MNKVSVICNQLNFFNALSRFLFFKDKTLILLLLRLIEILNKESYSLFPTKRPFEQF